MRIERRLERLEAAATSGNDGHGPRDYVAIAKKILCEDSGVVELLREQATLEDSGRERDPAVDAAIDSRLSVYLEH